MVDDPQFKHNEMIIGYDHPIVGKVLTTGFTVKFIGVAAGRISSGNIAWSAYILNIGGIVLHL